MEQYLHAENGTVWKCLFSRLDAIIATLITNVSTARYVSLQEGRLEQTNEVTICVSHYKQPWHTFEAYVLIVESATILKFLQPTELHSPNT